ncbi:hypothetical protein GSY71_01945 [Pusillimonas sp. TS35]|nr:hypothetical protein [Pusillimonas sp. TS35]
MSTTQPLVLMAPGQPGLVFGIQWFATLDATPESSLRRLAREHHATHTVPGAYGAGTVGLARLATYPSPAHGTSYSLRRGKGLCLRINRYIQRGSTRARLPMYSAAQALAGLLPTGSQAFVMQLEDGVFWLAGVHEGAVITRADRLFTCRGDAEQAVADLRLAYPALGGAPCGGPSACPDIQQLRRAIGPASQLQPAPARRAWPHRAILVFLLAFAFAIYLPDRMGAFSSPPLGVSQYTTSPPMHASTQGLALRQPGAAFLEPLLVMLQRLPVVHAGWVFNHVDCAAVSASDASMMQWHCTAAYDRRPLGTSASFVRNGLPGWSVSFPSLDEAKASWTAEPERAWIPGVNKVAAAPVQLQSALQEIAPAFSSLDLGSGGEAMIRASPQGAAGGAMVPRSLHLAGPLRSLALLLPHESHIAWHRATLRHQPAAMPGLRNSRLHVTLEGTVYEASTISSTPAPEERPPANPSGYVQAR